MSEECQQCFSVQSQADAWKAVVQWLLAAESTADSQARQMYAQDLLDGASFDDWYDAVAGRENGFNSPPASVLKIIRPYLFGRLEA